MLDWLAHGEPRHALIVTMKERKHLGDDEQTDAVLRSSVDEELVAELLSEEQTGTLPPLMLPFVIHILRPFRM